MKFIKTKNLKEALSAVGAVEDALDRIEDNGLEVHVDVNLATADQVAVHNEREKIIADRMKEKEEETKGIEGEREPKKISNPSWKKMYLSESLFEDEDDEVTEVEGEEEVSTEVKGEEEASTDEGEEETEITVGGYEVSYDPSKKSRRDFEFDDLYEEISFYLNPDGESFINKDGKRSSVSGVYKSRQFGVGDEKEVDGKEYASITIHAEPLKVLGDDKETVDEDAQDFTLAKFIADRYADLGVFYEESLVRGEPVLSIWVPEGVEAPRRYINYAAIKDTTEDEIDDEVEDKEEEVVATEEEPLKEDITIVDTMWIGDFDAWGGGEDTLEIVRRADKLGELDNLINEWYPEGLSENGVNDLLRFEDKEIFDALGINPDDYKDEEESE